jgi:hypothetical protein
MPSRRLPVGFAVVTWVVAVAFLPGENRVLGVAASIVGYLVLRMHWRPFEAPALLFTCGYQWLQAFAPVIQAELHGRTVGEEFGGAEFELAVWYSLLGVLLFSTGAALALRWLVPNQTMDSGEAVQRFVPGRLAVGWAVGFSLNTFFPSILQIGGLRQGLMPLTNLGMIGLELLIFQVALLTNRGRRLAVGIILVELGAGLLGYFSGFRSVLYMMMLAALSLVGTRRNIWHWLGLPLVLLVTLSLFWQTIKSDYRSFVSEGERVQIITVSWEDRASYLWRAVEKTDLTGLLKAADGLLDRLGYVTYFGLCIENVPKTVPHTGGRLWVEAVTHVFMPRVFFPNKRELNDSERTNEFTGVTVAGVEEGTSIGIGYIGESYVDFGVPVMFLPVFLFGGMIGGCYGLLVRVAPNRMLGVAAGTSLVFGGAFLLESSNAKMFGGVVATTLVLGTLFRLVGKPIGAWLCPAPTVRQPAP